MSASIVAIACCSCAAEDGAGAAAVTSTTEVESGPDPGADEGGTSVDSGMTEPVDAASTDGGCHRIQVFASSDGREYETFTLCEGDVGCDTGDDALAYALDPAGVCWVFPNPCVPKIWVAQGWREVGDCPSGDGDATDASVPADSGLDGGLWRPDVSQGGDATAR